MSQNKKIYHIQAYGTFRRFAEDYKSETYNSSYVVSKYTFLFSKGSWYSRFGKKPKTVDKFYSRKFCFFEPRDLIKQKETLPAGIPFGFLFIDYYRESYETF